MNAKTGSRILRVAALAAAAIAAIVVAALVLDDSWRAGFRAGWGQ